MLITWIGHATVLIELDGTRLLTDPLLGRRAGPFVRIAGSAATDLDPVDAVLISHMHSDHVDVPSLRRLGRDVRLVVPAGTGGWLRRRGFRNLSECVPGDECELAAVTVSATAADHDGRRWPGTRQVPALGFLVRGSKCVYFAGDTDLFDGMADLAGHVDVALLPVGGWGPNAGRGHMGPDAAAEAAGRIRPSIAIPIHWGTLALPMKLRAPKRWANAGEEFAALTAEQAPDTEVRVLRPGDHTLVE